MMKTMVSPDVRGDLEQIKYWILGGGFNFRFSQRDLIFPWWWGGGGGGSGVGGYSIFFCIYLIIVLCPNIALKIAFVFIISSIK